MRLLKKYTFEKRYEEIILENKQTSEAYIIMSAILTDEASINFFHYDTYSENLSDHIISIRIPNKYGDLFSNISKLEKDIEDCIVNFMKLTNSTVRE